MTQTRFVLALAAAVLSTGCFQMATTVTVDGDGSGTVRQRLLFTRAAMAQLQQLAAFGGNNGKTFDPLSEDQARADADKLGPGVTFVSSTPIDDASGQGRETLYAFTDIRNLRVTQEPAAPGGLGIQAGGVDGMKQPITFGLSPLPGGNALLTITMPKPAFDSGALALAGGRASLVSPEQLELDRQMFAGARLSIAIRPGGTLVRSSSPYVAGNAITLLDVDFDQLMAGPVLDRLRSVTNADDARAALKDLPGLKVSLDPQITIEFTPAR